MYIFFFFNVLISLINNYPQLLKLLWMIKKLFIVNNILIYGIQAIINYNFNIAFYVVTSIS